MAYFNPHFLSLTFETGYYLCYLLTRYMYFNPHFLSLTFETVVANHDYWKNFNISILIF